MKILSLRQTKIAKIEPVLDKRNERDNVLQLNFPQCGKKKQAVAACKN